MTEFNLPEPTDWVASVGDNGEDALSPEWSTRFETWIPYSDGVAYGGEFFDAGQQVDDIKSYLLAGLAAVAQHREFRRHRGGVAGKDDYS